MTDNKD